MTETEKTERTRPTMFQQIINEKKKHTPKGNKGSINNQYLLKKVDKDSGKLTA